MGSEMCIRDRVAFPLSLYDFVLFGFGVLFVLFAFSMCLLLFISLLFDRCCCCFRSVFSWLVFVLFLFLLFGGMFDCGGVSFFLFVLP